MNPTVRHLRQVSNGELSSNVATHSMDVLDAAYHTAHSYPGGVPALAQRMPPVVNARGDVGPMSASTLQHKVNPNCLTHNLALREARDMMVLSENYSMLHALASELGHVCIRSNASQEGSTLDHVMRSTKEFGEVLAMVARSQDKASHRGKAISANELRSIEREAGELIGCVNALIANLRTQVQG